MLGQQRDVFGALAQWRQHYGNDVQAVVQVVAERPGFDHVPQVLVGGSDDAHVRFDGLSAAKPLKFAFLQHAQQFGLHHRLKLGNFVQEKRPAVGQLEAAFASGKSAGEGAAFVAEKLGFKKGYRDCSAVDGDERAT